jgi:hypothetical protein
LAVALVKTAGEGKTTPMSRAEVLIKWRYEDGAGTIELHVSNSERKLAAVAFNMEQAVDLSEKLQRALAKLEEVAFASPSS